ncbi:DNA replication and repair protein RecF [Alphaproteobacteria bacterium]|nr:DNA replication and repair protein RecF [Alphaproteobacteria bacterium]
MAGVADFFLNRRATGACVRTLCLTGFREYEALRLADLPAAPIVLYGHNGAGKTNLAEAVSWLAPGRGLRRAALREVGAEWSVAAELHDGGRIATGYAPAKGERRVIVTGGGRSSTQDELAEMLTVWWLTPAFDRLWTGEPAGRRRFFGRLLAGFARGYAPLWRRYETARAQLAKVGDPSWQAALTRQMAEAEASLRLMRAGTLAALNSQPPIADFPAAIIEADEAAPLHLADFAVRDATTGRPAAKSSTGEQKALVLSVFLNAASLLAQVRGRPPVLILDDVASFLDEERRKALFSRLSVLKSQCWLTGTERPLFDGLGACFYRVEGHKVRKD